MSILDRIDEMLDRERAALIEQNFAEFSSIVHLKAKLLYELHAYWRTHEIRGETAEEQKQAKLLIEKLENNMRLINVQREAISSIVNITRKAYGMIDSDGTYSSRSINGR